MSSTRGDAWAFDLALIDDLCPGGTGRQTVRRRIRRGQWQEPAPGVVCRTTGALTADQWRTAALLYAGPGAALSHHTAGEFWGYGRSSAPLHVTVVHGRHRRSTAAITVHQTRRPFTPRWVEDFSLTPPARTAIDICLGLRRRDAVVALLGRALQRGLVSLDQLGDEVDCAPRRGSRLSRSVLAELAVGSRAASESRLLSLIRRAGLPLPELNAAVTTSLGVRYIDALWRHLGKGVEVDGQAFHLDPVAWRADLIRQNAIQTSGIVLLRIAAARLWTEPEAVLAEIIAFLGLSMRVTA